MTIALAVGSSLPASHALGNRVTTVTITDDDTLATTWTLTTDKATFAENSGTTPVKVTATRGGTATAVDETTLAIAVAGGTAKAGEDFTAVTGFNITVAAGATSGEATFNLAVTDDTADEVDETVMVNGTLQGNTVTGAELTITDNDNEPGLSIADANCGGRRRFGFHRHDLYGESGRGQWQASDGGLCGGYDFHGDFGN